MRTNSRGAVVTGLTKLQERDLS